jgi:hypothetical protein
MGSSTPKTRPSNKNLRRQGIEWLHFMLLIWNGQEVSNSIRRSAAGLCSNSAVAPWRVDSAFGWEVS